MWWLVVPAAIGGVYAVNQMLEEQRKKRELLEQIKLLLERNRGRRIEPFLELCWGHGDSASWF